MSIQTDSYRAIASSALFLDRSDRVRLDVLGPDRAKFLHNLVTNEVNRLLPGQGVEAFVTSPQGKTLGYVILLACEDRVILRTDPDGIGQVLPHFQKYGVFDEIALEDKSAETFEYHVAGPRAHEVVERAGGGLPDAGELRHRGTAIAGAAVRIVRESPLGESGLTIAGARIDESAVNGALHAAGADAGLLDLDADGAEVLRIEAGTPVFGRDVTAANLPQEVGRDSVAISFVKGCYLGQETVARIDALGHVNKILRGLRFSGEARDVPTTGAAIEAGGNVIGAITSAAFSPRWNAPVALGYVRAAHAKAGTEVVVVVGEARVKAVICDLPMRPA
jgi:folate-binding protein YgfZ